MTTEQRRDAVADTFIRMICETILDSIRVQDIAQRAGISKATFYRLFRDKYDVMSWIYRSTTESMISASPELKNGSPFPTKWKRMRIVLQNYGRTL